MTDWARALGEWRPAGSWRRIVAVDAHTAGEPLRVILGGFPDLDADTILGRRRQAREGWDRLRTGLMWEPRGHADMYGCIVVPPVTEEATIGVLFTHNQGFSTMCGHGIIGVVTVLLECGLLACSEPMTSLGIDTPAGLVRARAHVRNGRVHEVAFDNVASFAPRLDAEVEVGGLGTVRYDLGYGGAFYAYVDAADFGLRLMPSETPRLIELGRLIKDAVQAADPPEHPDDADLGFMYGTIFVGAAVDAGSHSRNVCVFADGEVDRSPTGTGVSGRLAIHRARGELAPHEEIVVESILGTTFRGRIVAETTVGGYPGVVSEVTGSAWITGRNELLFDPEDPLVGGFLLR